MHKFLTKISTANFRITHPNIFYNIGYNYLEENLQNEIVNIFDNIEVFSDTNNLGLFSEINFNVENEKNLNWYRYSIKFNENNDLWGEVRNEDGTVFESQKIRIPLTFFSAHIQEIFNPYCQIVKTDNSLAFYLFKVNHINNRIESYLICLGTLKKVNEDFNYYSRNSITKSYILTKNNNNFKCYHYIQNNRKFALLKINSPADYPIICQDPSLIPSPSWLTDFIIFDDALEFGYPYIGLIDNIIKISHNNNIQDGPMAISDNVGYLPIGQLMTKKIYLKTLC